jgi:hypothetical protein
LLAWEIGLLIMPPFVLPSNERFANDAGSASQKCHTIGRRKMSSAELTIGKLSKPFGFVVMNSYGAPVFPCLRRSDKNVRLCDCNLTRDFQPVFSQDMQVAWISLMSTSKQRFGPQKLSVFDGPHCGEVGNEYEYNYTQTVMIWIWLKSWSP